MKRIAWGVGVAVVAAGVGAYVLLGPAKSQNSYMPPAQEQSGKGVVGNAERDHDPFDVTITYMDEGFEPRDITITQGTRVRFLNQSENDSWPASNVHPTHTLYPEKESTNCLGSSFDACRGIQKGEFYDFTFNYIGEWRFHDHLRGYHTGTITVTAPTTVPTR